ncbi:MAG: hypothetical protein MHPSP_002301, partial [Paramarteilia canceri]
MINIGLKFQFRNSFLHIHFEQPHTKPQIYKYTVRKNGVNKFNQSIQDIRINEDSFNFKAILFKRKFFGKYKPIATAEVKILKDDLRAISRKNAESFCQKSYSTLNLHKDHEEESSHYQLLISMAMVVNENVHRRASENSIPNPNDKK